MRQYLQVKDSYPDAILFFRMGDFYEMFFEDAVIAAKALDLTLTSRDKGKEDAIPMAGVPHHAGRGYIARLTELGHKVVICEQVEDPKQAKGLVKREVVRVVTPGVVLDDEVLDPKTGRYLAAISVGPGGERFGLAYLDASTGEFGCTEVDSLEELGGELARISPREVLGDPDALGPDGGLSPVRALFPQLAYSEAEALAVADLDGIFDSALAGDRKTLGVAELPLAARAAAQAIEYARATQPVGALPLTRLHVYRPGDSVVLDEAATANLELVCTLMEGKKRGSLLGVLDRTKTGPGGRLLRRWLLYPLTEVAPIRRRQDAVEHLVGHHALRDALRDELAGVADVERLAGRVSLRCATPRDLGLLRDSLERLPSLVELLRHGIGETSIDLPELLRIDREPALLDAMAGLAAELRRALVDQPGAQLKDGGFIREGFCPEVDENRRLADGGKDALLQVEGRERERTGIGNLKVKFNRVFGYFIEVTRSQLDKVPDDYTPKQTIANAMRYVTTELAELESKILSAQETLQRREVELFEQVCAQVLEQTAGVIEIGRTIAACDSLAALADVAHERGYVRPTVDDGELLDITDGRHPVIETTVGQGQFVPNDCRLEPLSDQILLVTGPNMAGKSTYMRQVAQIALMAQMGSFVPAGAATVGVVDRIFTRVGAADNLARGESTFMVEMRETAAILAGATRRSLVVLDEVGRGTSTFDGVSIAWAVTEYLHDAIGCRTLFATHYHELCALSQTRPRIKNVSAAVREHGGGIVFLRRIVAGGANKSYGIEVGKLAGLPRTVVSRARSILRELEGSQKLGGGNQLDLFGAATATPPSGAEDAREMSGAEAEVADSLRDADINNMTPMQAMTLIADLKLRLAQ